MPCSCAGMSRLEMREAIALGVAGIEEMSMAFGFDCPSCRALPATDEAPRQAKDAPPFWAYGRIGLLPSLYFRRN